MSQDAGTWIPYSRARAAFLAAGGARLTCMPHPGRGPEGEELAVDVAILGGERAPNLLFVVSGTHGIEGLCGSRVQTRLVEEWRTRHWADDTGAVLVHALNPHGFAWSRRVTEDGVDLARNFVDFSQPLPANPAFSEIADALVPSDFHGQGKRIADEALQGWIQRRGPVEARAIARGQYSHPTAPFYGGSGPTWSNRTFRALLRRFAGTCRRAIVVDIHSGLGPWGEGHLIGMHDAASPAAHRGEAIWSARFAAMSTGEVGYPVTGSLAEAVAEELPGSESLVATYEFGVGPERDAVEALRADHWLHCFGEPTRGSNRLTAAIREQMRRAFFDASPVWRDAVHAQAAWCCDRALRALTTSRR